VILAALAYSARCDRVSSLFLGEEVQSLYALLDRALLSDLVKRLMLFFDVVLIFVVDVHISALNIGEACK
jgi:hypothetical protein